MPSAVERKKERPKDVFGRALPTEEQFEVLKNAPRFVLKTLFLEHGWLAVQQIRLLNLFDHWMEVAVGFYILKLLDKIIFHVRFLDSGSVCLKDGYNKWYSFPG